MFTIYLLLQVSFCQNKQVLNANNKGNGYHRHDRIDDDTSKINLRKTIFSNFKNTNFDGGAIYINKNQLNCTITDVKFDNCIGKLGGAIYLKSTNQRNSRSCSIYNALFTNCQAINGGALYLRIGEIERHSIIIEGCTFKYNAATRNGGAICAFSREKLAIQRCRFEDNEAVVKGSSMWCRVGNENGTSHDKLILYRNSYSFTASSNNLVNVYIESNIFNHSQNSKANVYLGLCSFVSTNKSVNNYRNLEVVEKGRFESFNLTDCNCVQGSKQTVDLNISTRINLSNLIIFNCESIDQCQPDFVIESPPPLTENCVEYPNRQDYIGGSGIELGKACFSNFRSPIQQDGGAIHVINAQLDLEKCRFINCSTDGNGGAIFATIAIYDCEIEIEDCLFDSCTAFENGGAVYVCMSEDYCEMEVDNTNFTFCTSHQNGGAFYVTFEGNNCNLEFEDSLFTSCLSYGKGGALYFFNYMSSRSEFETCNFTNNTASDAGAFYYSPFSYSKMCECEFINNSCTSPNCSSSVHLVINPNKETCKNGMSIKEEEGEEDEDDNVDEDIPDGLTNDNVVLLGNVFCSDPIKDSTQLIIDLKENADLLLGKNSFSFNEEDEEAEKINSNYIRVYQDDNANVSFNNDGFICIAGNSTTDAGIDNIQTNCTIQHVVLEPGDDNKRGSKSRDKRKIGIISGTVVGVVSLAAIVALLALVIIPFVRKAILKKYRTNLDNGGDSIVSNINQETNEDVQVQL